MNALLVLVLGLHIVNCAGRFDYKSDCLTHEGLDKDLHTAATKREGGQGGEQTPSGYCNLKGCGHP